MFRDATVTSQKFSVKFGTLKREFDKREKIHLDSEYHQELQHYIEGLHRQTCQNEEFDDVMFNEMREVQMSQLNRLQKMKNATSYKKEKHKAKSQNEDWG